MSFASTWESIGFICSGCSRGDILRLIHHAHHTWLPPSGYQATTLPSYTLFKRNHFLSDDGHFDVAYYLPVQLR